MRQLTRKRPQKPAGELIWIPRAQGVAQQSQGDAIEPRRNGCQSESAMGLRASAKSLRDRGRLALHFFFQQPLQLAGMPLHQIAELHLGPCLLRAAPWQCASVIIRKRSHFPTS